MDDVTADMLTEQLDEAEGQEATLNVLVAAAKAQIRCQHSLGCRLREMDNRLSTLDRNLENRIDQRISRTIDKRLEETNSQIAAANKRFDETNALIRSCPAHRGSDKLGVRGFGVFKGANLKDLIILILAAVIATMAGININQFFGG